MNNKETRGGKRKGSGRKSQYGEPTKTIAFRVPLSLIQPITKHVKSELQKAKHEGN